MVLVLIAFVDCFVSNSARISVSLFLKIRNSEFKFCVTHISISRRVISLFIGNCMFGLNHTSFLFSSVLCEMLCDSCVSLVKLLETVVGNLWQLLFCNLYRLFINSYHVSVSYPQFNSVWLQNIVNSVEVCSTGFSRFARASKIVLAVPCDLCYNQDKRIVSLFFWWANLHFTITLFH